MWFCNLTLAWRSMFYMNLPQRLCVVLALSVFIGLVCLWAMKG
jgi:hypothetical protein